MNFVDIIRSKRDGRELSREEIDFLVQGISEGSMPDYQIAALAMAIYFQGMSERETADLTVAMAYSGEVADLSGIAGKTVDKHSTGGVGDKTTMIVLPLVAALGVPVAKMSGRGLGHTGGTIDKFESIPGFRVEMEHKSFIEQVNRIGAAVISQTGNLVPADKKLYAIRDVTATVESIPLIASSVMSKKLASGAEAILLDVKTGRGAFMKEKEEAIELARLMVKIGQRAGRQVRAVISNMDQPLGRMIGNALEVKEAIDTLKGKGPSDLEELCLVLASHMLILGEKETDFNRALNRVREVLAAGKGLDKFMELVKAQGGSIDLDDENYGLPEAQFKYPVIAERSGYIAGVDAYMIGYTAMHLGAGREKIGDSIDYAVGIELNQKTGDKVAKGDVLAFVHANHEEKGREAVKKVLHAYQIEDAIFQKKPLIFEVVE
ncbi:pyrimidine-nucleoside phosphorylase [Thermosyntropha lipolytica DSM 11003]|uniref:Pyrimidine-nucleoside phosphorylase n=1 Tax=Thermosyntropha lipolytica DSM 11003 TaxID=1123382 RepID=A0A1M5RWV1_9FIRM|nr:pyrimidine-nucleoside phosphorylase [Thermosyntropha lipolytica]SHH30837.1 pyrimidine-nucleoside phosphorylase [Thermosyntropha lipolytica DSM 11003]